MGISAIGYNIPVDKLLFDILKFTFDEKNEQMTKFVVNSIECKDNLFAPTVTVPGSLDLYQ